MEVLSMLSTLGLIYGTLYLIDSLLKSFLPFHYSKFIRLTGLYVGLFQLQWTTTRYNSFIQQWASNWSRPLRKWFAVGSVISTLLIVPATYILVSTLVSHFSREASDKDQVLIQPLVPGINVPKSDLGYYALSLLICTMYHELGHALSAAADSVSVMGFGVFLLVVFPAAYVDLSTEQLFTRSNREKLRVFSAGVWHNIILVLASIVLFRMVPLLAAPGYRHQSGLCILTVAPASPVLGPSGLKPGDELIELLGRPIHNKEDFYASIAELISPGHIPVGYCVPHDFIASSSRITKRTSSEEAYGSVVAGKPYECCGTNATGSLCFAHSSGNKGASVGGDAIGGAQSSSSSLAPPAELFCLPVRDALDSARGYNLCNTSEDCRRGGDRGATLPARCLRPQFSVNETKLVQVARRHDKDFLFVGNPALIYTSVTTTEYCPKWDWLAVGGPEAVLKLLHYIASFSGALAVLNVVPSYMLDGNHMIGALVEMGLSRHSQARRNLTRTVVTLCGTVLVISNIILGISNMFSNGSPSLIFL